MDGLNQFFVSRILGSTMKHAKRPSFGPLGSLHAQHQTLANRPKRGEQVTFTPPTDRIIARAFEETRQGMPIDRVLADPELAAKFIRRCHQLEVRAPAPAIVLRLFQFRKSPGKLVRIPRATVREPRRDFSQYLFASEMASAQIRYRFGASVDDILGYTEIGGEFDRLAAQLMPGFEPLDYRLAALHVRKSRYCKAEEASLFDTISSARAENTRRDYGSLDRLDLQELDQVNGILGLVEDARLSRFLYITQASSVSQSVLPFTRKETFAALANSFWSPSLSSIHLVVYGIRDGYDNISQSIWAKKLIHDKMPIFNWPIHLAA